MEPTPPPPPALALSGPPAARGGELARTRLVRRIAGAEGPAVVLLRAPAGYGKTTLLAQWAVTDPRPCAWIAVGDCGAGGEVRTADVVAAIARGLHAIEPLAPATLALLTAGEAGGRALLGALAAALAVPRAPFALVLDDADALRDAHAAALLELLAARLGGGSQLALAARAEPALALARLRAEDRLLELRAAQLAFDEQESARLLQHAGFEPDDSQASALAARAEGWPAGLALALRALHERAGEVGAAAGCDGADRLVSDYVREQLLDGLARPARELLVRSAPLGELSGELCDAVLERRGSGLLLRELAHGNVPLAALDRAERRFRLHPLVADALLAELRVGDAAWEPQAHRRASAWSEGRGETARAIDHAVAAGDAARAGELLWPVLPIHALGRAPQRLERWLTALGEERVAATPALAHAAALRRLARGRADEAGRFAAAAAQLPGERVGAAAWAGRALLRAALARGGAAQLRADAVAVLDGGVEQRPWRALACLLAGVGEHVSGDRDAAQERLEDGVWQATEVPLVEALCLTQLALLALDRDDPQRAVVVARRALACAQRGRVAQEPLCAPAFAVAAFAHAWCGLLEEAGGQLAHAQRLACATAVVLPAWHEAQLRFALARTLLRLSDAAGARAQLARMSRAVRQLPDALVLHAWIEDGWARADAFAAGAVRGPARLTLAELRVLRLLPSHFSLPEIALRLHVSANTVKTQAQAVYRKLDVRSRSEAVARAREVGLVEGPFAVG